MGSNSSQHDMKTTIFYVEFTSMVRALEQAYPCSVTPFFAFGNSGEGAILNVWRCFVGAKIVRALGACLPMLYTQYA